MQSSTSREETFGFYLKEYGKLWDVSMLAVTSPKSKQWRYEERNECSEAREQGGSSGQCDSDKGPRKRSEKHSGGRDGVMVGRGINRSC